MTWTPAQQIIRAGAAGDVLEAYDATERAANVTREIAPDLYDKIERARALLFEVRVALDNEG